MPPGPVILKSKEPALLLTVCVESADVVTGSWLSYQIYIVPEIIFPPPGVSTQCQ